MHIPVEVLPRFDFPQISIITHQAGATAEELETMIARPLESRIFTLPNLVSVRSTMGHGIVQTDIRFAKPTRNWICRQSTAPLIARAARYRLRHSPTPKSWAMRSTRWPITPCFPPMYAVKVQRALLTRVVPALRALPGVQRVDVYGSGDEALWVQPDLQALRHYRCRLQPSQKRSKDKCCSAGGVFDQGHQDVLIETRSLPTNPPIWKIRVEPPILSLRDLARIVQAAGPIHNVVELDGRPAIALTVFKQPGASTLPVTRAIQPALTQPGSVAAGRAMGRSMTRAISCT